MRFRAEFILINHTVNSILSISRNNLCVFTVTELGKFNLSLCYRALSTIFEGKLSQYAQNGIGSRELSLPAKLNLLLRHYSASSPRLS